MITAEKAARTGVCQVCGLPIFGDNIVNHFWSDDYQIKRWESVSACGGKAFVHPYCVNWEEEFTEGK